MEDRSALFNQLKNFSQRKLKKVETKVVTASGEQLVEKRGAKGLQVLAAGGADKADQDQDAQPPRKLDLQVGLILPGFLLGSQDVAHDKSSLDTYGITHILSLDREVDNKFEDDYNYKNVNIQDKPDFELEKVFDDCFDFIDDGRHYGNVLIHCSGTIGLSRSTSICIAYMMNKEKQSFNDAFNNVKEARSFVKPNEGFVKQLKEYEVKLRGAQQVKESGIDDPFALRKKQEIEQEKAMVAGAASVKNRMKMFGATLDANANNSARSKSVSPSPYKFTQQAESPTPSKWSANKAEKFDKFSKSMTPEPKKTISSGPPPPPPPMPSKLHDEKSVMPLATSNKWSSQPPPPPPPPTGDPLKAPTKKTSAPKSDNNESQLDRNESFDNKRMVFGRVPPPPMKIKGGQSIEKHDAIGDKNMGINNLPSGKDSFNLKQRCASPLVLMNNVPPQLSHSNNRAESPSISDNHQINPFKVFQEQEKLARANDWGQLPKRTVSLGPKRLPPQPRQIGDSLKKNPWMQKNTDTNIENSFHKAAEELRTSLNELNNLIDSIPPPTPKISTPSMSANKSPKFTSYISETPTKSKPTFIKKINIEINNDYYEPPSPPKQIQTWNVQEDLHDWRSKGSMSDLRSIFENQSRPDNLKAASTLSINAGGQRPPRSSKNTSSLQLPLKRQPTLDSSVGDNDRGEPNPRAPSPSAALRAAKQQASEQANTKASPTSDQHRPSVGQLNRSSTKKILNLIKTKTKSDLTLPDGDENDEIEALLGALENESIENIDWDELGLDEDEIKEIIEKGAANLSSSSSSSEEEEDEDEEEEVEEEEVEKTTQHFIIRSKW